MRNFIAQSMKPILEQKPLLSENGVTVHAYVADDWATANGKTVKGGPMILVSLTVDGKDYYESRSPENWSKLCKVAPFVTKAFSKAAAHREAEEKAKQEGRKALAGTLKAASAIPLRDKLAALIAMGATSDEAEALLK